MSVAYHFQERRIMSSRNEFKIVQDPINGPVKISTPLQKIIDTPEFQRLRYIRQLGMCHLVFPGANHTRFEHSVGTMHLAMMFADSLHVKNETLFAISALLHDIGHPPLSHGAEDTFQKITGLDHLNAGVRMILGEKPFENSSLPGAIEEAGVRPSDVSDVLLFRSKENRIISRLISGPVDVDELDYLRRDSLYTGVSIGNVDHRRILNVAMISDDDVFIEEKGLGTMESILIARILMYGSVYFHKTSRIAQIMASKAILMNKDEFRNPFTMTDNDFYSFLSRDGHQLSRSILTRNLHKPVLREEYSPKRIDEIRGILSEVKDLEDWEYIVDIIPPPEFSGPGRVKSDMGVLRGGTPVEITQVSPLIRTLRETLENKSIVVSASKQKFNVVSHALGRGQ